MRRQFARRSIWAVSNLTAIDVRGCVAVEMQLAIGQTLANYSKRRQPYCTGQTNPRLDKHRSMTQERRQNAMSVFSVSLSPKPGRRPPTSSVDAAAHKRVPHYEQWCESGAKLPLTTVNGPRKTLAEMSRIVNHIGRPTILSACIPCLSQGRVLRSLRQYGHELECARECKTRASGARLMPTLISELRERVVPS